MKKTKMTILISVAVRAAAASIIACAAVLRPVVLCGFDGWAEVDPIGTGELGAVVFDGKVSPILRTKELA
jgi:hypothetical protein